MRARHYPTDRAGGAGSVGRVRRLTVVLALAALLAWPALGAAHAVQRSAEPAPGEAVARMPAAVRVALGAPVEEAFLSLRVRGPDGALASGPPARDPNDPQALLAPLTDRTVGVYRVEWRAFSQDGHPSRGSYAFSLGAGPVPTGTAVDETIPDDGPLAVSARLLALVGPLGLLGLVVVRFGVIGPAWRTGGRRPPGTRRSAGFSERAGSALETAAVRWWGSWGALAGTWALGLALLPAALLRAIGAREDGLDTLVLHTRWGVAWMVEVAALLVTVAAGALMARSPAARRPAPPAGWSLALGAPPAIALLAAAWAGHASSGSDRVVSVALDTFHSWATAAWLGGLVALAALVPAAARRLESEDRVRLGAGVVVRFSTLAVGAVGLLVVTGVYRALAELSSLSDLVDTGYGRALLVKLAIFAVMLLGGAYNRFVVHPRLERAAIGLEPSDRGAMAALRTSVAAELALAAAVMVAVAVLVSLPPP
jgi:copper transport protein